MDKKSILIFGVGPLQKSLIERCKLKGLFTVGIDPNPNAECKSFVDTFEVVAGDDFDTTISVANKYNISGVITAATDKPLVMMARVAEKLNLPFFSIETAECSTDKLLMKQKFKEAGIPCANGILLNSIEELNNLKLEFPVIVKPRDNSGSRGVIYCTSIEEVENAVKEALQYTKKGSILIEEFIEGKEYSIESIHFNGESNVIQYTEKITTDFPYNVELGHIQPANITEEDKNTINELIHKIAESLGFNNCASHTELKINSSGIFIIETSPRLGGDFITSTLVPLSIGVNIEDILIDISMRRVINEIAYRSNYHSGVCFLSLPNGVITKINREIENVSNWDYIKEFYLKFNEGDNVNLITNSVNRHGYFIIQIKDKYDLKKCMEEYNNNIKGLITIN